VFLRRKPDKRQFHGDQYQQAGVDRGAKAIVFASCMKKGTPIGYPCPHFAAIKDSVEKKLGAEIRIIDWTH